MLSSEDKILIRDFIRSVNWLKAQKHREQKVHKPLWVKVTRIMQLTGWDKEGMRRARENKLIDWKRDKETGIWYDELSLNSLSKKTNSIDNPE